MPAPYTAGPQSPTSTGVAAAMTVMAAEAVALFPNPPAMQAGVRFAFGNILVDFFAPRTSGTADPVGAGVVGQLHVNTTSGDSFLYNGTAWKKLKYDP